MIIGRHKGKIYGGDGPGANPRQPKPNFPVLVWVDILDVAAITVIISGFAIQALTFAVPDEHHGSSLALSVVGLGIN